MNFKKAALEPDCTQMRARKMETLYSVATKEPSGCCSGEERRMVTGTLDRQSFMGSEQTPWIKYWFELVSMWLEPGKSGRGWGVVEVRKT